MQSGINVPDVVREEFLQLRMKRKYRYIIYRPNEDKSAIEIEKLGDRSADWSEFKESIPKQNSR